MKKSVIALIALLSFFAGMAGGTVCGILMSPIKQGFNFKFVFSECGNKNVYKMDGNKRNDKPKSPLEKITRLPGSGKNKK